jgi:hypothetical protein
MDSAYDIGHERGLWVAVLSVHDRDHARPINAHPATEPRSQPTHNNR